jgi:hypothetical protein
MNRKLLVSAITLAAGCSLYSEVSIRPLVMNPVNIQRGTDMRSMEAKADFLRGLALASQIEARPKRSAQELATLGAIELSAGRYDDARRHLRAALDLNPFHEVAARIAWSLAQVEYLSNNFESSLEWTELAAANGLVIKQWHVEYLRSLQHTAVYRFTGSPSARVPLRFSRPDVPRVNVGINGARSADAVIDSGAVLSIVSERAAAEHHIRRLGDFQGTFFGLLGEPIPVRFGLLDTLTIGELAIESVPVAIMPDDKMRFLVSGRREFHIDFLIGANLLKEMRTDLDFPRGEVTFTPLRNEDRRPAGDQNLFIQGFRPFVRGTVNRHGWYLFVFDTGSEITFLNELRLDNLPVWQLATKVHDATLQGLGGSKKRGAKIENVEVGIDRWAGTFRTVPVYAASDHESAAGIIGENFLKNFRVVLDFGRMRVDLIRSGAEEAPPIAD